MKWRRELWGGEAPRGLTKAAKVFRLGPLTPEGADLDES